MLIYRNRTRHAAIVTIKIESTDKPEAALKVGSEEFFEEMDGKPGIDDLLVSPGKELHTNNNTVATLLAVRNAP
jgi:hypothetical protein